MTDHAHCCGNGHDGPTTGTTAHTAPTCCGATTPASDTGDAVAMPAGHGSRSHSDDTLS